MTLLEVAGVAKTFGSLTALEDVDLVVDGRQFHGLIGPNGSGKSTLLKCIAGDILPSRGTVRFAGEDITEASSAVRARAGLSIKFQITSVLPRLSVEDNVLLALQAKSPLAGLMLSRTRDALRERGEAIMRQFRLLDRAGDPASSLSHGQQQWLEIAMALAPEPKLLLLDEPTAGMSIAERRVTGELLALIKDHCSLVIVEHDLDFIRDICDVLTVLDQGRVLESGTVEQIRSSRKVQEVYLTRV
jgi:branched-chain amino acid transport system ATP-binding protein/urea transport system ATP-binding protein